MDDEAPTAARDEVRGALEAGLRPVASQVVSVDEAITQENREGQIQQVGSAHGVDAVVVGNFSQIGQLYEVEAEIYLARDGSSLASVSLNCGVCSWTEALETMQRIGESLRAALPGFLSLSLTPDGVTTLLDGQPLERRSRVALAPGPHHIEATAEGHNDGRREVTIISGVHSEVTLDLTPIHIVDPPPSNGDSPDDRARRLSLSGWLVGTAGAAGLVTGIVWFAVNGQCDFRSEDIGGICAEVYRTWPQGLMMSVAGVGLLSAGIALLLLGRRARRGDRDGPELSLSIKRDGASAGIRGRF